MYAIAFDLHVDSLKAHYHNSSYPNAYKEIGAILEGHGFGWKQGSVYFGDAGKVNAVTCVMAVMDLTQRCPWFAVSVRDIRMLRIEENNDLMPPVQLAATNAGHPTTATPNGPAA